MNNNDYMQQEEYFDSSSNSNKSKGNIYDFLLIFLILFPFSILLTIIQYLLFVKKLSWRQKYTNYIMFIESFIIILLLLIIKPFNNLNVIFENITTKWNDANYLISNLLSPYIFLTLILSVLFSFILYNYNIIKYKKNKVLMEKLPGLFYDYKFKYSIFEKMKIDNLTKKLKEGKLYNEKYSPLGISVENTFISSSSNGEEKYIDDIRLVSRYYTEADRGTLYTGSTGAGKTKVFLQNIYNDIKTGRSVLLVDFKKGPEYPYLLSKEAKKRGIKFYHFVNGEPGKYSNPYCDNQASYDPLGYGSTSSLVDILLNLREWDTSSNVYKERTKTLLNILFYVSKNVDKEKTKDIINWNEGGLYTVISILKGNNLCLLIEQIERQFQELEAVGKISSIDQQQRKILLEVYEKISDPREKDFHAQMGELHGILSSMVMSNYGPWLAKSELTPYHINLKDLLISDEQNIILFQFNQLEDEEFTRSFGNIILGDISRVSSMKYEMGNEREVGLYIDEFQAVSPLKIKSILEKVRSSKFLTNLSTQSLQQVIVSSPENGKAVLDSIKDTINNFIVLAGSTEEMAEIFSGVIGKAPKKHIQINFNKKPSLFENYFGMKKESYRYSEQIKEDYIVTPYEFQSLSVPKKENNFKSIGYYITKASSDKTFQKMTRTVAQKLQFILSDEVLEPIPKSFTQTFEENTKLKTSNYNKNDILSLAKEQAINKNNNIQEDISQKNNVKLKTISLPAIELEEHNINTIQNKPSLPKRKPLNQKKSIQSNQDEKIVNHIPKRNKKTIMKSVNSSTKLSKEDEINNIFS